MSEPSTVSIRICQEGHANALALNKECSQIAVAGRSLLKVFSIENDGFTEVCNMRGGKNQNLSYSSNDVAWSTLDNNILATAATNGIVSVWDLSKFGRQKQLLIYNEHERTAHTVVFHNTEQNILLSGSQDGTIKCFDLRVEKSICTYFSNSESVRDVKFSPHSLNVFSVVSENGAVQLWDIRRSDKCLLQFTAHSGPIYTSDWHHTKNWLATGSRDKQIKVWNMESKASLEYTIHTIAAVGRVKWRPEKSYHIASCALVVDYSIHVWDIRRPYIPFASFNEHTNVTTGISWKGNDSQILLSTSKDSTIYKHAFKDAIRPTAKANPQGASLNYKDDLLYAYKVKIAAPTLQTNHGLKSSLLSNRQKNVVVNDQFYLTQSNLKCFTLKPKPIDDGKDNKTVSLKEYEAFIGCAKEYILSGKKLIDICEHNAEISRKYGKINATFLWNFIKILYGNMATNINQKSELKNKNSITNRRALLHHQTKGQLITDSNWNERNLTRRSKSHENTNEIDTHNDDEIGNNNNKISPINKDTSIDNETEILDFISPRNVDQHKIQLNSSAISTLASSNIEPIILEKSQITLDNVKNLRDGFLYVGPHDFTKALTLPEAAINDFQTPRSAHQEISTDQEPLPPADIPSILKVPHIPAIRMWQPHNVITNCLTLQTDIGDVQTSVSILIALGEHRNNLPIDNHTYENWFHSYVEQLHHHQLWNEATMILNYSWFQSVRKLNQQSTSVHTSCGDCKRQLLGNAGWYCNKCKSSNSSKCSVCHLIVRGLYAWCQGCSHGGHLEHMEQWFSVRTKCPQCGHLCEYE